MERDTVELTLADPSGKWLGSGMGDIWDNRVLFKQQFRFPEKGTYIFTLEQAMRIDPLPQIMDVGIRIEKALQLQMFSDCSVNDSGNNHCDPKYIIKSVFFCGCFIGS